MCSSFFRCAVYATGLIMCFSLVSLVSGEPTHDIPPYTGSDGLEAVKMLAGQWSGSVSHEGADYGDEQHEISASYEVTSNGSAVIERIFIGTPMEMTSVYYDHDGKLTMTHYCAVANRPTLTLQQQEQKDVLSFTYSGGEDLDPQKDMHIHGLVLRVNNEQNIVQEWQGYSDGKPTHSTVLNLVRKAE